MSKLEPKVSVKKKILWVNLHELKAGGAVVAQVDKPLSFLRDGSTPGFHFVPFVAQKVKKSTKRK